MSSDPAPAVSAAESGDQQNVRYGRASRWGPLAAPEGCGPIERQLLYLRCPVRPGQCPARRVAPRGFLPLGRFAPWRLIREPSGRRVGPDGHRNVDSAHEVPGLRKSRWLSPQSQLGPGCQGRLARGLALSGLPARVDGRDGGHARTLHCDPQGRLAGGSFEQTQKADAHDSANHRSSTVSAYRRATAARPRIKNGQSSRIAPTPPLPLLLPSSRRLRPHRQPPTDTAHSTASDANRRRRRGH